MALIQFDGKKFTCLELENNDEDNTQIDTKTDEYVETGLRLESVTHVTPPTCL